MRVATAIVAGFLALASTAPVRADHPSGAKWGGPAPTALPEALDAYYPPAAGAPVYLFKMLRLESLFSGMAAELMEGDIEGARSLFGDFRSQYREAAGMVPEWKGEYPETPVTEFGAALAAGDRSKMMHAFTALGEVCHRCHVATMVPVQQRFHWGDFGAVTVIDPVSGAATGYPQFKKFLAANLAGITVDLRQGQTDNARRQFQGFKARFQALRDSCRGCHGESKGSFSDRGVQGAVDEIGEALTSRTVSADAVAALAQRIGRENCSKCHLVHVPAALAASRR